MDPKRLDKVLKTQKYIMDMRPIFNMDALFSDQTKNYMDPIEPKR